MYVQYDQEVPPLRRHPWTIVEGDPEAKYWNFRDHPELIPQVLEHFKPYAHYSAVTKFYELLTWLNGPDSIFETNDCVLGQPKVDAETPRDVRRVFDLDPVSVHGRLAVIFRELTWNASRPHFEWLKTTIHDNLRDHVSNYPSVVFIGGWPHHFAATDQEGSAVLLQFWAWGDDENMMMNNLEVTFDNLLQLFMHISELVKQDDNGNVG